MGALAGAGVGGADGDVAREIVGALTGVPLEAHRPRIDRRSGAPVDVKMTDGLSLPDAEDNTPNS